MTDFERAEQWRGARMVTADLPTRVARELKVGDVFVPVSDEVVGLEVRPGRWINAAGGHPAVMVSLQVLDAQLVDAWRAADCPGDDPNIRLLSPLQMSPPGAKRLAGELLAVAALLGPRSGAGPAASEESHRWPRR
jgi:hypothetical protein